MGRLFIIIGLIFLFIGFFLQFFKDLPFFKLPGDIVIEKENINFYFPITSSIILSIILSFLFLSINKFKG